MGIKSNALMIGALSSYPESGGDRIGQDACIEDSCSLARVPPPKIIGSENKRPNRTPRSRYANAAVRHCSPLAACEGVARQIHAEV